MSGNSLDKFYRTFLLPALFTKGWGDPEQILKILDFRKKISHRETCVQLVPQDYPVTILSERTCKNCRIIDGKFTTPLALHLPEILSPKVSQAFFQIILPLQWKSETDRPTCLHFAGTGDHYFWRRRLVMVNPLLKEGIAGVLLENPFYGQRKPKDQFRACLHHVSDIFVMGVCLVLECQVLLRLCEKMGLGPLGVSGLSMGGHMASISASNWPKPLVLVPCLSWSTASGVFTEGVLSDAINWDLLQNQYFSDKKFYETLCKSCKILDNPFECSLASTMDLTGGFPDSYRPNKPLTPFELVNFLNSTKSPKKSNDRLASFGSKFFHNVREKEALWLMRGIMDECTHLKHFSVPVDTSLVIVICAQHDRFVPRQGCSKLQDLWPGSTVRFIESGHVDAYLRHRRVFIQAIVEAFQKARGTCDAPQELVL